MIVYITWLACISTILPIDSIIIEQEFSTITIFQEQIYGAPFTGNAVYTAGQGDVQNQVTFTDDPLYRIKNFQVTPFALYVNNGKEIVRFFLSTMSPKSIVQSEDICCFDITPAEEVIYADRGFRAVFLLDYIGKQKHIIEDLMVYDLCIVDARIYILTNRSLTRWDEHGNIHSKNALDETFNGMYVHNDIIFLFMQGQPNLHVITKDRHLTYELPQAIRDISGEGTRIYILNDYGTVLYIYNLTDF